MAPLSNHCVSKKLYESCDIVGVKYCVICSRHIHRRNYINRITRFNNCCSTTVTIDRHYNHFTVCRVMHESKYLYFCTNTGNSCSPDCCVKCGLMVSCERSTCCSQHVPVVDDSAAAAAFSAIVCITTASDATKS